MSLVATLLFAFLVPFTGSYAQSPYAHPPYERELDLRVKRASSYVHYALLTFIVMTWKIFARDPLSLLIVSLILQFAVLALHFCLSPCAYAVVNRFSAFTLLYPVIASCCSVIQIVRFGTDSTFVCSSSDPLYMALISFLWLSVVVLQGLELLHMKLLAHPKQENHPGGEQHEMDNDHTEADGDDLQKMYDTLLKEYQDMSSLRQTMHEAATIQSRENTGRELAKKRLNALQMLREYRIKKEELLPLFYLGTDALVSLAHFSNSNSVFTEMKDKVKAALVEQDPAAAAASLRPLDIDEMERFHLGPQIGRGSYGTVHMAMLFSGQLVAVKLIPIVKKKKETLGAVRLEVDMLKTLEHKHVIRYYGFHFFNGKIHLFMEFAVRGSLTSFVRKFRTLAEPLIASYTRQILEGLEYLHSKKIVHRDIKGENILIDGAGVIKLADFGCSKSLSDIANRSQNGCGTLVGSPYWMAPEVIKSEAYGTKADIWSVGCTVVEMLNGGDPPWHKKFENVYSAMFYIGNTGDIPSNIPENTSALCRDFLARCFERDASLRANAEDLLKHPWLAHNNGALDTPLSSPEERGGGGGPPGSNAAAHHRPQRQWSDYGFEDMPSQPGSYPCERQSLLSGNESGEKSSSFQTEEEMSS
jgi:serine/threonine protein kinase